MKLNQSNLVENKELREEFVGRTEVLDRVGNLLLLDELEMATTEMVASYYGEDIATIKWHLQNNGDEFERDGYKVYRKDEFVSQFPNIPIKSKRGGFDILNNEGEVIASGSNKGIALFPKHAILRVGMLLRDSIVADEVKKELGIPCGANLFLRKEIEFKKWLDMATKTIYDEEVKMITCLPTTELYEDIRLAVEKMTTYIPQYSVCNNKYRIDFYFPILKLAIEYDEKYHNSAKQMEKDKVRENEIIRERYIKDHYKDVTKEDLEEWEMQSYEELYDVEMEEGFLDYSWDTIEFIRVKEGAEMEGFFKIIARLSLLISRERESRGMSCKYKDLHDINNFL